LRHLNKLSAFFNLINCTLILDNPHQIPRLSFDALHLMPWKMTKRKLVSFGKAKVFFVAVHAKRWKASVPMPDFGEV
ncbi:MAG: hypothetical protein WBH04_09255, partial [Albidovulum sp.]